MTATSRDDVDDAVDEFSFLPAQAEAQGRAVPAGRRLALTLPDGRALSGIVYGEGRPDIVLLHGAGLNAHTWDATAIELARPVLALDLPGHGDSSWRDDAAYLPRSLARDVVRAIEEWADGPVVLVGQSLGGLTAAAVAAARPDLVARLVVVDIAPGVTSSGGPAALRRFYEETDFASRDALVERALAFGLGGSPAQARRGVFLNSRVRPDGRVEWKHHYAQLLSPGASVAAPALSPEDGWADLAAVAAPLLLVRGTEGYVSEADAAEYARRLPAAEIVALGAPHNVQEVAFRDLASLIARPSSRAGAASEGQPE